MIEKVTKQLGNLQNQDSALDASEILVSFKFIKLLLLCKTHVVFAQKCSICAVTDCIFCFSALDFHSADLHPLFLCCYKTKSFSGYLSAFFMLLYYKSFSGSSSAFFSGESAIIVSAKLHALAC